MTLVIANPERRYPLACRRGPRQLGVRLIEGPLAGAAAPGPPDQRQPQRRAAAGRFEDVDGGDPGAVGPRDRRRRARRGALDGHRPQRDRRRAAAGRCSARARSARASSPGPLGQPRAASVQSASRGGQRLLERRIELQRRSPCRRAASTPSPPPVRSRGRCSCRGALRVNSIDDPVPDLVELVGVPADLVHHLVEGVEPAAHAVVPAVGVRLGGEVGGRGRLELRVDEREDPLDPVPVERRRSPP